MGENKNEGEKRKLTLEDVKRMYGEEATIDPKTGAIKLPKGIPQGSERGLKSNYDGGRTHSNARLSSDVAWISTESTQETKPASTKPDDKKPDDS